MAKYWIIDKRGRRRLRKLTDEQVRKAHAQGKRLMKYEDRITTPYALATWQVKKGYKIRK